MGKNKKNRAKKNWENEVGESVEDGIPTCSHITKAVNFAAMRKALTKPACTLGECTSCTGTTKGKSRGTTEDKSTAVIEDLGLDLEPTFWVCLQCGHQGCDRNSRSKHALKHYETPHSGIHCLVVNLTTWATWCYACDDEVPVENKRILECVEFLRKQSGISSLGSSHPAANENLSQNSSQAASQPANNATSDVSGHSEGNKSQAGGISTEIVCRRVKGLTNLGNTCFFNAVMQNLCQTQGLEALLIERCRKGYTLQVAGWKGIHDDDSDSSTDREDKDDDRLEDLVPINIVLGDPGPLTASLLNFLQEMNTNNGRNTVTPNKLFGIICNKASRFKGFAQQDSQELLRYLVDVVRNEEIKRAQGGILKCFNLPEKVNPKELDEDIRKKVKDYGRQVKFTFLDSMFGGQLVSTITCEECRHVSQTIESFLDLSLPVNEEKPQRPNQMLGGRHKNNGTAGDGVKEKEEEGPPLKGVEGFAARAGKPSKYQERKLRKHAKKEAKKKGRTQNNKQPRDRSKSEVREEEEEEGKETVVSEEKEGGEEEEGGGGDGEKTASQDADKEERSAADVRDSVENAVPRLQMEVGDNESNLSADIYKRKRTNSSNLEQYHRDSQDSEGEASPDDLDIKSGTQKETHILPAKYLQSGDSVTVSAESVETGIKERNSLEIEKLTNEISKLELCELDFERTKQECSDSVTGQASSVDEGGRGGGITELSQSCSEISNTVTQDVGQASQNCERDLSRTEEYMQSELTIENGSACLENNTKDKQIGSDSNLILDSLPIESTVNQTQHVNNKSLTEMYKEARQKSKTSLAARYQPMTKECSVMSCLNQFTAAELLTGSNRVKCATCTKPRPPTASAEKDKKGSNAVYSNASKQFLILTPPAVLTLHLKRFEQVGFGSRKVDRHVEFPKLLDLAPYCSSLCYHVKEGQRQVLYSLYGVVEHSGRLHGGHYTAFVKVRPGLDPVNHFLLSHLPKPHDFIHRYVDQLCSGAGSAKPEASDTPSLESLVPEGSWFYLSDSHMSPVTEAKVLKAQAYLLFYERIY